MVREVYSVYDKKAGVYCFPFYMQNRMMALRSVKAGVMDETSFLHKFPADYDLYLLGSFDDESGSFVCGVPVFVVNLALLDVDDAQGVVDFVKEKRRA